MSSFRFVNLKQSVFGTRVPWSKLGYSLPRLVWSILYLFDIHGYYRLALRNASLLLARLRTFSLLTHRRPPQSTSNVDFAPLVRLTCALWMCSSYKTVNSGLANASYLRCHVSDERYCPVFVDQSDTLPACRFGKRSSLISND